MQEDPTFVVGWLESEGSLSVDDIEKMGIDTNRFYYDSISRHGAAEEALNKCESVIMQGLVDMFVINSLKCLVPSEELEKGMEQMQVGLQARMNAKMMRKLTTSVTDNQISLILIQHLTTDIRSPSKDPLIVGGGKAIIYGASTILDLRKKSIGEADPFKREEATKIGVTIRKNHVVTDRFPYCKVDYYAVFGEGIDTYLELTEIAVNEGILIKSGAFIKVPDENGNPVILPDGTKLQWQGNAKFKDYCKSNKEFFDSLVSQLDGNINVELVGEDEAAEMIAEDVSLESLTDDDIIEASRKPKKK